MNRNLPVPFILVAVLLLAACTPTIPVNTPLPPGAQNIQPTANIPLTGPAGTPTVTESATAVPTQTVTQDPPFTPVPTQAFTLAPTQPPALTDVNTSARLNGYSLSGYNGACQASLTFTANITSSGAGSVTYFWLRSNGLRSLARTLTFTDASYQSVSDTWTVSASGTNLSASDQVYIDQPNHKAFSGAGINLTCNPTLPTPRPARPSPALHKPAPKP